ncbi:hypothetical protein DW815_04730 [Ruminococcus sp. AM33-14]|nr:hypothetical protein DW815_04730 [Ruminococcus sp. AM33-14]
MEENREKNNKKIENEKRLEQDLRQMADDVILPDSLEPEAIQKMLQARQEEKQQGSKTKKNKKNWKRIVPIAAAACVCVIVGATVGIKQINKGNNKTLDAATIASAADQKETTQTLITAKDYKEIEKCIKEYNKQMARDNNSMAIGMYESASSSDAASAESSNVSDTGAYSDTNLRENGVGEADIVKTDGKNIYTLCRSVVTITAIDNGSMEKLASIEQDAERYVEDIYVQDDKLVLFGTLGRQVGNSEDSEAYDGYYENNTYVQVYDISDPSNPKEIGNMEQSGGYNTSRIVDGYVYVLSQFHPYEDNVTARDLWYIPEVQGKSIEAENIYMPQEAEGNEYTIITAFSLDNPSEKTDSKAVFGYSDVCYVSENNIYITSNYYEDSDVSRTLIRKISYTDGKLVGVAQTKIKGMLNDSFSIDEYEGNLRLVTTIDEIYSNDDIMPLNETADKTEKAVAENVKDAVPGTNSLYVLNDKLEIIGSIHNLAKDEIIYSARFMGDTGYFVTYRQVDPLFSVDLSDPENPKILGELKIPGFSEYLHPYGDGKLLGIGMDVSEDGFTTEGVKLSMFNVTDPSNVTEENKYTIEESYGTDVGYNYKGVFVDVQKNLFGFVTYHDGVTYQLYTYDEAEGFKEVMSRQLSGYEGSRGLYIGDVFYLVSGNMIESYSMQGFEKIDDIVL